MPQISSVSDSDCGILMQILILTGVQKGHISVYKWFYGFNGSKKRTFEA